MPFDPFLPDALVEAFGPAGALDALEEHIAQAEALCAEAADGPDPARAAHRLAGCAGQLGMEETAAMARGLEQRLREAGGLPSASEAAHLRAVFAPEWNSFRAWIAQQET